MEKYRVGIVGATGMVGQRFISLLKDHPWFEVNCVAASARSAGKTYREAVGERWAFSWEIPEKVAGMTVVDAADIDEVSKHVDFVFCAVDMKKDEIRALEEAYAKHEIPVVSNNSACRGIEDVPMVVPEINADHLAVIEAQKKRLGTKNGFIAVKPNCSIQSYVPALTPLLDFEPEKVSVCTYQAISGAGKTFIISSSVASGLSMTRIAASTASLRLCGGIFVARPTAMPDAPFTSRFGYRAGSISGSLSVSSKLKLNGTVSLSISRSISSASGAMRASV